MSKDRSTSLRFAVVGFGTTVLWLVYQILTNPSPWSPLSNILSVIFMILCPPSFLTIPLIDVEIGSEAFYPLWTIVALLNAALYAVIGAAYVGMRKKREGEATN